MTRTYGGIRVIDLSNRLSGAWAARLFGDQGAEVILAEPRGGHPLRQEAPFNSRSAADDPERSLLHAYVNANKHSVIVETERQAAELCASADIVITTGKDAPPTIPKGSIHLSITPHGLTGPWADVVGDNLTACARVGWAAINKRKDEPPLQLPIRQTGYIAGVAGFIGAAAALYRGGGEVVDVSEMEALALTCLPWGIASLFAGDEGPAYGPYGVRQRGHAGPLWRTRDGQINYAYGSWRYWQRAMRFLGRDDLADHEDYVNVPKRRQQDQRLLRDALGEASAMRDKWELFHGLSDMHCYCGVVQDARELCASEQLHARGFVREIEVQGRTGRTAGAPVKLSATPWRHALSAPTLGGHEAPAAKHVHGTKAANGKQPLHGVRALCFTHAWAGTFCTQLLALLGADVVQIEAVRRPDVWRGRGASVPPGVRNADTEQSGFNTNGLYNSVNANKRAITLDVTDPKGRELLWELIPRFDVLVENFTPRVMANWGITLESLQAVRPDMIFASVSGYGWQGPLSEYAANGATTEPMAGLSSIHGYEDDEPMNTGGYIPDPISGYYLAASIIAALEHRKRTGEGQRIDAAMMETVAMHLGDAMLECDLGDHVRRPGGNRHPTIAPHGMYAAASGGGDANDAEPAEWIAVAAGDDAAFARLAEHIGRPELATDERFATMAARKANEDALDQELAGYFASRGAKSEAEALARLGIEAARCEPLKAVYSRSNPQFEARGFLAPVTHPESGTHLLAGLPWICAHTPRPGMRHAPLLGEHSAEVFDAELGITAEQYQALVEAGITGTGRPR